MVITIGLRVIVDFEGETEFMDSTWLRHYCSSRYRCFLFEFGV